MPTLTKRATVFTPGVQSWSNTANAVDGGSGTFASWSGFSTATDTAFLSSFDFSSLPAGATINSVTVTVKQYVTSVTGMNAPQITPMVGVTALDSPHNCTLSTSTGTSDTIAVSGVSLSNLQDSTFQIRFVSAHNNSIESAGQNLDYIEVNVDYSLITSTAPTAIASSEAFGTEVVTPKVTTSPTGVATAQAFGTTAAQVYRLLSPTGLASAQVLGQTDIVLPAITQLPTGIASAEAVGTPSMAGVIQTLVHVGVSSLEAFGDALVEDPTPSAIAAPLTFQQTIANKGASATLQLTDTTTIFNVGDTVLFWMVFDNATTTTPTVSTCDVRNGSNASTTNYAKKLLSFDSPVSAAGGAVRGELWGCVIRTAQVGMRTAVALSANATGKVMSSKAFSGIAKVITFDGPSGAEVWAPVIRSSNIATVAVGKASATPTTTAAGDMAVFFAGSEGSNGLDINGTGFGTNIAPDLAIATSGSTDATNVSSGIWWEQSVGTTNYTGQVEYNNTNADMGVIGVIFQVDSAITQNLVPFGKVTDEAFGTTVIDIITGNNLQPTALASTEGFGTPVLAALVAAVPVGLASSEIFGTQVISTQVGLIPVGVGSGEALGTPILSPIITLANTGIATGQAFGTTVVSTILTAIANGIATAEAFGTSVVSTLIAVSPTGVASAQAIGAHTISQLSIMTATGIASLEAFGVAALSGQVTVVAVAIGSAEAFGTATLAAFIVLQPTGLASAQGIGVPTVGLPPLGMSPTGIASLQAIGTAAITSSLTLTATQIDSLETHGVTALATQVGLSPTGVASGQAIGTAIVSGMVTVLPDSILTSEVFGSLVAGLLVTVQPDGIASEEAVPVVSLLAPGILFVGWGIPL